MATERIFALNDEGGLEERRERVVRCRDCEHGWNDGTCCDYFTDFDDGKIIPASVEPDGFCAWGKERGGE